MIETSRLPTHIARVATRANVTGTGASGDTFLMTSYVSEAFLKTITIALCAAIRQTSETVVYELEYELAHADGLGTWESVTSRCTGTTYVGHIDSDLRSLVAWLTARRTKTDDDWARQIAAHCKSILGLLGMDPDDVPKNATVSHLLNLFVRIRNKTKAHGAVGSEFFAKANFAYSEAVRLLLDHAPIQEWNWYYFCVPPTSAKAKVVSLAGSDPYCLTEDDSKTMSVNVSGIYFRSHPRGKLFSCGHLLRTTPECTNFGIANGGFTGGIAEFIDYATGATERVDVNLFTRPPAPLPPSVTEGMSVLDVYCNTFGNLPPRTPRYINRPLIQKELRERLVDRNHVIITLHGRGGSGKTSLALHIAHELTECGQPPFDHVIWLSARDLELKPTGATPVRRAVPNLDEAARLIGGLLDYERSSAALAKLLQDPHVVASNGILFVFDNFETFDNPREIHQFLDTHTHIPNKVLITSRERAFKGDYPVEVAGMEFEEAEQLLRQEASELNIGGVLTESAIREIYDCTEGHAYVMRVLLGEISRERKWVAPKTIVPRRSDLLSAVFERSFNRLTPEGRRVFLCVANWRSTFSELALIAVLGIRDLNAEDGIEECLRLSLISRHEMEDKAFAYSAPELARRFGQKKLEGDPDRLLIQDDLEVLRKFGVVSKGSVSGMSTDGLMDKFLARCIERSKSMAPDEAASLECVLERCANLWPGAWAKMAKFCEAASRPRERIEYALRRAVEEMPFDKAAWIARAEFAATANDDTTHIGCLVSAVDADPGDVQLMRQVALNLCKYVDSHKYEIPPARRGVYLASVRSHMEKVADRLDATGLSRLAWLFLLEENQEKGWQYANAGLAKDSTNNHCLNIVERLHLHGYQPNSR